MPDSFTPPIVPENPTKSQLDAAWEQANRGLAELTAQRVPEDDPRVQELLGVLDRVEWEMGELERNRSSSK